MKAETTEEINARIGWTGNKIDNILQGLVKIDLTGDKMLIGKAKQSMDEMWKKIDEVLSPTWFNKEMAKLWREYLKGKEATKGSIAKS